VVTNWLVKPVEVDDVPVVMLGLWSDQPDRYGDFELRRFADEITTYLQQIPDTNQVTVFGGRPRTINVLLNPQSMTAHHIAAIDILQVIKVSNQLLDAGQITMANESIQLA
jgi:multidrug efflux pump subunit AcrB